MFSSSYAPLPLLGLVLLLSLCSPSLAFSTSRQYSTEHGSSSHHHSTDSRFSASSSHPYRTPIHGHHYDGEKLIFSDDFTEYHSSPHTATSLPPPPTPLTCPLNRFLSSAGRFDLSVWEHELTMGGGGNWEFEYSTNNRSNSFVRNSTLFIKPTLTADFIGEANVQSGYTLDMWGSSPADQCTGNAFYGCERTSGGGGNIINPIQSANVRMANSLPIKYGRVEVSAKLPVGTGSGPPSGTTRTPLRTGLRRRDAALLTL